MAHPNQTPLFDQLPVEILRRIAIHGTASSVLNLAQSNKTLKAACWDTLLFQALIDNNQALWGCRTFDVDSISRRFGLDTAVWARFALADQKAMELKGGLDGEFRGHHFEQSLKWAPQLIILNHPFISSQWLALMLSQIVHGIPLDVKGVFCFAAAMLSTTDDGNDMVAASQSAFADLPRDIFKTHTSWKVFRAIGAFAVLLRQVIKNQAFVAHNPLPPQLPVLPPPFGLPMPMPFFNPPANLPLGLPNPHPTGQPNVIPPASLAQIPEVHPPSAVDIQMHSVLSPSSEAFPLPMADGQWDVWHTRHVRTMTDPSFLTSGSWRGYYTDSRVGWPFRIEPPMTNIRFCLAPAQPQDQPGPRNPFGPQNGSNTSPVTAPPYTVHTEAYHVASPTGADGIGAFNLAGTVTRDGRLLLRKTYAGGAGPWEWQCGMTPFGIFGSWGVSAGRSFERLGAVWIWREDWETGRGRSS